MVRDVGHPAETCGQNTAMIVHGLPPRFRLGVRFVILAMALCVMGACAQMPEERPLTPQEAQQELAYLKESYQGRYVPLIPTAHLRLNSGIVFTVASAKVVRDTLLVTGTIRNATPKAIPAGHYGLALLESFPFQVAKFEKEPVKIGSCGGPCGSSHHEIGVDIKRLPPGQSSVYSVKSVKFAREFPHARASEMIFVVAFFQN